MLSDYFPPHAGGGVERVVFHLGQALRRLGVEVAALTLDTAGAATAEEVEGMRVYRVPAWSLTPLLGLQSALAPGVYRRALAVAEEFRPDLVHTHNLFFMVSAAAPLLAARVRIPLVTTMHLGSLDALPGLRGWAARRYEATVGRWILRRSTAVLAVADAVRRHGLALGVPPHRISTVPNVVEGALARNGTLPPADHPPRVMFIGRLIVNKGPHLFVDAAIRVLTHGPDVHFVLVGDGPMRRPLETRVRRAGWQDRIHFYGYREDAGALLRGAALFVRPSFLEGLPLAVLEAMALGVPVVTTAVGGTSDIVQHGRTGWMVPPGNTPHLAAAISTLLADEPLRRRLVGNAKTVADRHAGWENTAQQTLAVYERLRPDAMARRSA